MIVDSAAGIEILGAKIDLRGYIISSTLWCFSNLMLFKS
jgi:hypothetical protein